LFGDLVWRRQTGAETRCYQQQAADGAYGWRGGGSVRAAAPQRGGSLTYCIKSAAARSPAGMAGMHRPPALAHRGGWATRGRRRYLEWL